jgi:hypothetical protein
LGAWGEGIQSKGFNFGAPFNAQDLTPLDAPKLAARAVGIESERSDFDRFLLSQRSTTPYGSIDPKGRRRLVELISLWLRLLFPLLLKILKSGIPFSGTFSERK